MFFSSVAISFKKLEKIKSYFETGKNASDEIVNINNNKVLKRENSKKIQEKVKIKYFSNRLIRKS